MANNRIFLLHIPTGYGIFVGKHLSNHWYFPESTNLSVNINYFYDLIDCDEKDTELILITENNNEYEYVRCIAGKYKIHQFKLVD